MLIMISSMNQKFSKTDEFIFCSFVPTGLEDYVTYFVNNFNNFTYLKWKFPHGKGNIYSALITYRDQKHISEEKLYSLPTFQAKAWYFLFLPINYLIYFMQAAFLLNRREGNRKRVFMGINYFCALCGIVLKKMGRVDFVIYRVMDFFPLPPSGPYRFLNRVFYMLDKFCLKNSDSIWFTTEGHIVGREKYGYFDRKKSHYQMIPLGLDLNKFVSRPIDENSRHSLVYCGVVSKYHMIDLLFEVVSELKKDFPGITLNLIGSGPDEDYFKNLSKEMGLEGNIVFHGFMEEGEKFRNIMAANALGIALYRDEENFMKYTEPAKVKYYLSFGVPAVISDVPVIAKELQEKKVSFAVHNNKEEIAVVIKNFISNPQLQNEYKKNIQEFVKTIDINRLLDQNFENIFK